MKLLIIAGPYEADRIRRASLQAGFETVAVEPGESLSGWITASRPELIVMAPQIVHADPAMALAKVRAVPRGRVPIFLVGDEADEARMRDLADGFFLRPVAPELLLQRARAILSPGKGQGSGPRRGGDALERTEMGIGPTVPIPSPATAPGSGGINAANEFSRGGRTPKSGPHGPGPRAGATLKPLVATSAGGSGAGVPARPDTNALMAKLDAGIDALFDAELTAAVTLGPQVQKVQTVQTLGPTPGPTPPPVPARPPAKVAAAAPQVAPPAPPEAKLEAKPAAQRDASSEVKLEAKPAAQRDASSEVKLEAKPAAQRDASSEAKLEAKPAAQRGAKSEAKPAAQQDAKPEIEPEARREARPEAKPAAKSEAKPAAQPDFAGEPTKKVEPILLGAALQASAGERTRARLLERYAPVEEGDYFAVLGVGREASVTELRRAHEQIIREIAPDALEPELARELAAQIDAIRTVSAEALRVLADDRLRPRYLSHVPK
jgi:hypothetical protein